MDSLTQAVLGAAVGLAVMRRRTAVWKSALWGAVVGTLPDLEVLVDHGDPILNMVLHRAESHALFWLALAAVPMGALVARLHGEWAQRKAWVLALGLALLTHPLLDALTVYGTQLLIPFTRMPYAVGSVFIIDPAVTLPWLVGVVAALVLRGSAAGLKANYWGLAIGVAYLAWGVAAQHQVAQVARAQLAAQGLPSQQVLVTPAPFSSVLWRVVSVDARSVHEGFWSFADGPAPMRFLRYDRGADLDATLLSHPGLQRVRAFSRGFYALSEVDGRVRVSDLRMGQYPGFVFAFDIATRAPGGTLQPLESTVAVGGRGGDFGAAVRWLGRRMLGEPVAPPGWPATP
ncbi:MAG: metal-dependent hydrolase [Rubrivivax sp.]|nr:metal-dependent hydrolase [Rubrivivax sp.]